MKPDKPPTPPDTSEYARGLLRGAEIANNWQCTTHVDCAANEAARGIYSAILAETQATGEAASCPGCSGIPDCNDAECARTGHFTCYCPKCERPVAAQPTNEGGKP